MYRRVLGSWVLLSLAAACGPKDENNGGGNNGIIQEGDMGSSDAATPDLDSPDADGTPDTGGGTDVVVPPGDPVLRIEPEELFVRVGETTNVEAWIDYDDETFPAEMATWAVGDPTLASFDEENRLVANDVEGATTVTVTVADFEGMELMASAPLHVSAVYGAVAAGGDFSCGTTALGSTYCWGGNTSKQLGNVAEDYSTRAKRLETTASLGAVSAGKSHACALDETGGPWCWGLNDRGQVGTAQLGTVAAPFGVMLEKVEELGLGDEFTCARTRISPVDPGAVGEIFCWGNNRSGQLGNPMVSTQTSNTLKVSLAAPERFIDLAVGARHACAITEGGDTYCWGDNSENQLGDQTMMMSSSTPVLVSSEYVALGAAGDWTCGRTSSGPVRCWGTSAGGLGDAGGTTSSASPVDVVAPQGVTLLIPVLGTSHACAAGAGAGGTYCWGSNDVGQLGDGTTTASPVPVAVETNPTFSELSLGTAHTCALSPMGDIFCWGANDRGQLGDGTEMFRRVPTFVRPPN